jgi:hypothetical protein
VESEIEEREVSERLRKYKEFKFRHMLMAETAEIAYDSQLFDLALVAAEFVLGVEWDP